MKQKLISTLLVSSLFGGCALTGLSGQTQGTVKTTNQAIDKAESQLAQSKSQATVNYLTYSDAPYFGGTTMQIRQSSDLPSSFQNPVSMDKVFSDMNDVANTVYKLTGIPTYVDNSGQSSGSGMSGGNVAITGKMKEIRITQTEGTLQDLLDNISSKGDIYWSYKNGKILLSQTETKIFIIKSLPGEIQVSNQSTNTSGITGAGTGSAGSTGSGSGGGSSSTSSTSSNTVAMNQNVQFTLNSTLWAKYEEGIKNLLSPYGKMTSNPNNGTVTVTDKPSAMIRVADYVQKENEVMDKQVQVDIQVLAVDTSADDNYGINWNLVFQSAGGNIAVNGQAVGAASSGTSAVSTPLFTPTATTQAFTFSAGAGQLSGSSVLINALSSLNRTSEITNTSAVTMSSQPVPIDFTQQISYLASVSTTVTGTTGVGATQTSLTPGQLNVGFTLNLLPVVEGKDTIRMQVAVSISNLQAMNTFSSGGAQGSTIQLPTVNNRTFMQKVKLKSNTTFVLTGFDDSLDSIFQQGVGSPTWWLFGGGYSASKKKTRMVMLVTPHIIEG